MLNLALQTDIQFLNFKPIDIENVGVLDQNVIPSVMNNLVRRHSRAPVALWRSMCTPKDASPTMDAKVTEGTADGQLKARESAFDKLGVSLGGATTLSRQRSVIDSIGATTFTVSGVRVSGSLLVMPTFSTLWNVNSLEEISPLSFTLIKLSNPRPDVVLIGTGSVMAVRFMHFKIKARSFFIDVQKKNKMNLTSVLSLFHMTPVASCQNLA